MELFEKLSEFNHIFVTGAQRSGTRICAKMIAHDLMIEYIDETVFMVNNLKAFGDCLRKFDRSVIQCPGMLHAILDFDADDTAIVFMLRPISEILASQKRIKWVDSAERANLNFKGENVCLHKFELWRDSIRAQAKHPFEITYASLSQHPLWVPAHKRVNFKWDQTKL